MKYSKVTKKISSSLKRVVLLFSLLAAVGEAWGTSYIIKSGNNYLGISNGSIANKTALDATCIWTAVDSDGNEAALTNSTDNRRGLFAYEGDSKYYYLTRSNSNLSLSESVSDRFYNPTTTSLSYYRQSTNYYLIYNNGWSLNTSNTNAATITALTSQAMVFPDPTISPSSLDLTTLNTPFSLTASVSTTPTPAYDYIKIGETTYYYRKDTHELSTTKPSLSVTYSWTLPSLSNVSRAFNGATASFNYTEGNYDADKSGTATVTATAGSVSKTASATVTAKKFPTFYYSASVASNINNLNDIATISVSSASGEVKGTSSAQGSATVELTFTVNILNSSYQFAGWSTDQTAEHIIPGSNVTSFKYNHTIYSTTQDTPTPVDLFAIFYTSSLKVMASQSDRGYVYSQGDNTYSGSDAFSDKLSQHTTGYTNHSNHTIYMYAKSKQQTVGGVSTDMYKFKGWSSDNTFSNIDGGTEANDQTIELNDNQFKVMYAMFKRFFKFKVEGVSVSNGEVSETGGTVVATFLDNNNNPLHTKGTTHETEIEIETGTTGAVTVWFEAKEENGYSFRGWYTDAALTQRESIAKKYSKSLENHSTGTTANLKLYASFVKDNLPESISIGSNFEVEPGDSTQLTLTYTPDNVGTHKYTKFVSSDPTVATVTPEYVQDNVYTFQVKGLKVGTTTITATAYGMNNTTPACSTSVTVTVKTKLPAPVITITQDDTDPAKASATIAKGAGTIPNDAVIRYTTDGTDPTAESPVYTEALNITDGTTVKAIMTHADWYNSVVASKKYEAPKAATPVINIAKSGNDNVVTFSSADSDITYYYTLDGNNPTTSSDSWTSGSTAITPANAECTIKVIATHANWLNSDVATNAYIRGSGVSSSTVYLNDLEDHNWSYYKGEETTIGNTTQTYKDKYRYTLYSPDPRNVKITYNCGSVTDNTVDIKVSPTEAQNQFVYYKTVEKYMIGFFTDTDGTAIPNDNANANEQYAYTVISNPFSVRPKVGSQYYGFAGWKIVSGAEHIGRGASRTAASNGDVLSLDEIVHFIELDNNYTANCISADIVLEATWTPATVKTGTSAQTFTGGTYETNFIVASGNIAEITQSSPCTIIGMNPDGTSNNSTSRTITGLKVGSGAGTVKVEYIRHGDGLFNANGNNLIMGRGITSSSGSAQGLVYGRVDNIDCVNTVKVESGYYTRISNLANDESESTVKINCYTILGCDYDRALANYYVPASDIESNAYNIKLRSARINGLCAETGNSTKSNPALNRGEGQLYIRSLIKSGVFASQVSEEYYFHSYQHSGQRYIEMEGGYNKGHIKGGSEYEEPQVGKRSMTLRMRNGRIDGQIGLGSTSYACSGERVIAITGGRFGGWIAPGSNCSSTSNKATGITDGESFVYFGGTAEINSRQFGTDPALIGGQSTGGAIYGAGLGYSVTTDHGQMDGGSNIVFADNAYCERGIYGGGALAQTLTTANIFILGGRVGTGTGTIHDSSEDKDITVSAGIYGGACDRGGENSFIYMSGGVVESGIYGGSNVDGKMTGNTNMRIVGGQIGKDDAHANVHGGGYGSTTTVDGNVDVVIGNSGATEGATIYGDVFGGSALGKVNTSTSNTTNVTLNKGIIYGALYGGGLGNSTTAADVNGNVAVKVYGGSVRTTTELGSGGVYGCNDLNGAPQGTVTVDIYGTDPAPAADQYALNAVYGGGNQSHYNGKPVVTVHNCDNSIKYVYGGGNASDVTGTDVTIYGGNVIGNVFGGGNGSSEGWTSGTNPGANVTNDGTQVKIYGGTILSVFGGSNTLGTITGGTSVVVDAQQDGATAACPVNVDNIFGAGNEAPFTGETNVQIVNTGDGAVGNVFGGGKGATAIVTGNTNVVIGDWDENHKVNVTNGVFGGGHQANLIAGTGTYTGTANVTLNKNSSVVIEDVYGGGNQSSVVNTNVTAWGATVKGDLYGGGKGTASVSADVLGNATTNVYGGIYGGIFGAGNIKSDITGTAKLFIDEQTSTATGATQCDFSAKEVYGAGNSAAITGGIDFSLGCISGKIDVLFGGAKNADLGSATKACNVKLSIISGEFGKVFGGNNQGGTIYGTITVDVQHKGCHQIQIDELYGGGNLADYNTNDNPSTTVENKNDFPLINIMTCGQSTADWVNDNDDAHCLKIGTIYGAGKGKKTTDPDDPDKDKGKVTGNPHVNVHAGEIGTIFGGGNAAGVVGNTYVNVIDQSTTDNQDIYITGNVYGGGSSANVTGKTNVQIGNPKPVPTP